ncbi:conserved hypothetical protein [Talaromyces stipitatus ATCC 10500]|uniref:Uncharacterized protein n=1 Tax=Talaromyces stipitatus (strain ATCC 10500 / CBS 375.48 / QM 6759 / NRRL 1006) TaxID=441959 RepID=B8MRJ5_TALSN|nr:uncharacterized protein TSTA_056330 [Talaromyces stipitatus ATCC 10500]EED13132.1 conserved hypothetical protein [Talaromyces stipitatus ATCC 10500]
MSSQRVIQDSDDDDGDMISDIASSCDPLQDTSFAPKATNTDVERIHENQPAVEVPFATNDLPQVDFDRFLRSESSIMAGDYEDERWVSTANSNSGNNVIQFGNYSTGQLQDDSFQHTTGNPNHSGLSILPPTSDGEYGTITEDIDHPSKRGRVSNTQVTFQHEPGDGTETDSSYNYFASMGPNGPPQTANSLPSVLISEEKNSILHHFDVKTQPMPIGTPPATIPFSEDSLPQEQEEILERGTAAEFEIQEVTLQQPPSETDTEVWGTKKKKGRPKKQDTSEAADIEAKVTPENPSDVIEQQEVKKKTGRSKKQEIDIVAEQIGADDSTRNQNGIKGEPDSTTATKASKKKIKRSKTTSDLPHNKSSDMKSEQDVVWIETNPMDSVKRTVDKPVVSAVDEKTSITEQAASEEIKVPRKRGRKRKGTVEEPTSPATENQAALQDISNIQQPAPQQDKQKHIEIVIDSAKNQVPDEPKTSNATETSDTLKPRDESSAPNVEIQSKEGGVEAPETPTTNEKSKPMKQTLISSTGRVPFRVGLSRRARIAPLLKVVRK